jgi:hypothetical protein
MFGTVKVNSIVQVWDRQIIFVEVGISTVILLSYRYWIQDVKTHMRVRSCFDHFMGTGLPQNIRFQLSSPKPGEVPDPQGGYPEPHS